MNNNIFMKEILKIWIFTCLISPLIIMSFSVNYNGFIFKHFIESFMYTSLCGLLLSSPSIIILYLICRQNIRMDIRPILSILSIILVFATFYLVGFDLCSELILPIAYSVVMILGIWMFKSQRLNAA